MIKTADITRKIATDKLDAYAKAQKAVHSFNAYMGACPSPLDYHVMRDLCARRDRAERLTESVD